MARRFVHAGLWLIGLCLFTGACSVQAQKEKEPSFFVFEYENDALARQDRWYTSGIRATWIPGTQAPDWLHATANAFPLFPQSRERQLPWSFSISQQVFTPEKIHKPAFPPHDRSYAAWLRAEMSIGHISIPQLHRLRLGVGLVGPAAMGEQAQTLIHTLTGARRPRGWGSQLHHEATLQVGYDRQRRFLGRTRLDGGAQEFTLHMGGSLGNALSQIEIGAFYRNGRHIPVDFGPPRLHTPVSGSAFFQPTARSGWYLFTGLAGRLVLRNLFLDGNTFRTSPHVSKRPLVGNLYMGLVYYQGGLRVSYTQALQSPTFQGQDVPQSFGAMSLTWQY